MSGLQTFRAHLRRLKHRRALLRWEEAIAWGIAFDIVAFFVLFAIDYIFLLGTVPRACLLIATASLLIWQAMRHLFPRLSISESLEDLALLLETRHGVDGDLIAALQFDSLSKDNFSSSDLREAVIHDAANLSECLDYRSVDPNHSPRRASWIAACAALFVVVFCLTWPSYASAFWNRLWLGDKSYPTLTVIESIAINGQADGPRIVEGDKLAFRVECSGTLPSDGLVRLRSAETGDTTTLVLARSTKTGEKANYLANGPKIEDVMLYAINIGDAETEFRKLVPIRRPIVELTIEATPPAYTQLDNFNKTERYVQVPEGSSVAMSLRCTNRKRLEQVQLELLESADATGPLATHDFSAVDDQRLNWRVEPSVSGITRVEDDIHFRVVVTDEDQLSTYHPIEGGIRMKRDRPPTASLTTNHFAVTAMAAPTFVCTAEDDFGIASKTLHARKAGRRQDENDDNATVSAALPLDSEYKQLSRGTIRNEHALELKQLNLAVDDKVLVWLEVVDHRGKQPGVSAISETVELEVLDDQSILELILQSDVEAEQLLTDAIEKELGLKEQ